MFTRSSTLLSSSTSHPTPESSIPPTTTPEIPTELWLDIFSRLSRRDLCSVVRVCRSWNQISSDNQIWKNLLLREESYSPLHDFAPLVDRDALSWKEVVRYRSLSEFFTKLIDPEYYLKEKIVKPENPVLQNLDFPTLYTPKPVVRCGGASFTITQSSDVKVQVRENITLLQGDPGSRLTHLAIDGKFLFGLRTDGVIVQWDHQTGQFVQKIQSAFAKRDSRFNALRQKVRGTPFSHGVDSPICKNDAFEVQNGFIVLRYGGGLDKLMEIVEYSKPHEGRVICPQNLPLPHRMLIKENRLFILGRNTVLVCDLAKKQVIRLIQLPLDPAYFTEDIHTEKNTLCASSTEGDIFLFDIPTGKTLKHFKLPKMLDDYGRQSWNKVLDKIFFTGNLLIGSNSAKKIDVIDLNNHADIATLDLFDSESRTLKTKALKTLVFLIKEQAGTLNLPPVEEETGCVIS